MGKINQGILGGFNGTVGTVVGAAWKGKSVMRGKAQSVHQPNTAAQRIQRAFFAQVASLVGQLSDEQIRFLFPRNVKGMTPRNLFARQLAEFTTESGGVKTVRWNKQTSFGNAKVANIPTVSIVANAGQNKLNLAFADDSAWVTKHCDEYAAYLIINATRNKIYLVAATYNIGSARDSYPLDKFGSASDTYYAVMFGTDAPSAETGFGVMKIVERPPRPKKNTH